MSVSKAAFSLCGHLSLQSPVLRIDWEEGPPGHLKNNTTSHEHIKSFHNCAKILLMLGPVEKLPTTELVHLCQQQSCL